jgi:tight adherence protein B
MRVLRSGKRINYLTLSNFSNDHRRVLNKLKNPCIFILLMTAFSLWFNNILAGFFIAICIAVFISGIFKSREEQRLYRLHHQLIDLIGHINIMLRAGKTLRYIFLNAWSKFEAPLGIHLKEVAENLEINPDLEEILEIFEKRSGSNEVKLITSGLKICNRIGGDMVQVLNSVSSTLRQNLKSRSRLNTLVLQSKYSANIISLFPIIALIVLYIFYGDIIMDFFSSGIGMTVLIAGGIMELAGIIIMKKIVDTGS